MPDDLERVRLLVRMDAGWLCAQFDSHRDEYTGVYDPGCIRCTEAEKALLRQRAEGRRDAAKFECMYCAHGHDPQRDKMGWAHHFGRGHNVERCGGSGLRTLADALEGGE